MFIRQGMLCPPAKIAVVGSKPGAGYAADPWHDADGL